MDFAHITLCVMYDIKKASKEMDENPKIVSLILAMTVLTLNLIPDLGKVLTVGFLLGSYVKISSMIPLWSMRYHLTE